MSGWETNFEDEAKWRAEQARTAYQPDELPTSAAVVVGSAIALIILAAMFYFSGYAADIAAWVAR